ncbi:MAG: hypothetical protein ACO2O6_01300 [Candidatus Hydrothermia bacterium]|jgi:hypothetical protein
MRYEATFYYVVQSKSIFKALKDTLTFQDFLNIGFFISSELAKQKVKSEFEKLINASKNNQYVKKIMDALKIDIIKGTAQRYEKTIQYLKIVWKSDYHPLMYVYQLSLLGEKSVIFPLFFWSYWLKENVNENEKILIYGDGIIQRAGRLIPLQTINKNTDLWWNMYNHKDHHNNWEFAIANQRPNLVGHKVEFWLGMSIHELGDLIIENAINLLELVKTPIYPLVIKELWIKGKPEYILEFQDSEDKALLINNEFQNLRIKLLNLGWFSKNDLLNLYNEDYTIKKLYFGKHIRLQLVKEEKQKEEKQKEKEKNITKKGAWYEQLFNIILQS